MSISKYYSCFSPMMLACVLIGLGWLSVSPAAAVTFTTDATIAIGDLTFDGQDVVVDGCTVTVNGSHAFNSLQLLNNAVLTHTQNGSTPVCMMDLTIAQDVIITAGCRIDVSTRGYGPHSGPGAGELDTSYGGGGGYGGFGGNSTAAVGGGGYGCVAEPADLGSGGAGDNDGYDQLGGRGGGAVRLNIGGSLTVEGAIIANGGNGTTGTSESSGGGSGGSIWIVAGVLAGGGSITANGGNSGGTYAGGGGGGRIALVYDEYSLTGPVTAFGGAGYVRGGAGTILMKGPSQAVGILLIHNNDLFGAITNLPETTAAFDALEVRAGAAFDVAGATSLALGTLHVYPNGLITHNASEAGFVINVSGDGVVDANGRIDVGTRGYGPHSGPGAGELDTSYGGGGGHGGYGGNSTAALGGGVYGSVTQPTDLGSGGAGDNDGYNELGGRGGGAVRLNVAGTLTVEGAIMANGGNGTTGTSESSGGGAGGSIWIEAGVLAGSGSITANGGSAGGEYAGGGGGGRIALYYDTFAFTGAISAVGHGGYVDGGAGSVYYRAATQTFGTLVLDNEGTFGAITDLPPPVPQFDRIEIHDGAILDLPGATTLVSGVLRVADGGVIRHHAGETGLTIQADSEFAVETGGTVNLVACGYAPRTGPGAGSTGADRGSGGGQGGYGGNSNQGALGGGVYGSIVEPVDLGSGGAGDDTGFNAPGGAGGGALHIVAGLLTIDGTITANGENGTVYGGEVGGGGAGGSLWVTADALAGNGVITADGGNAGGSGAGGGGGGRIAIFCDDVTFGGVLTARGGFGYVYGGAGTVYLKTSTQAFGDLRIDNGGSLGTITDFPAGPPELDFLQVASGGILDLAGGPTLMAGVVEILAGGKLTHRAADGGIHIIASAVTVAEGGSLTASGRGFGRHAGPGAGADAGDDGAGGGYGGNGGNSSQGAPGGHAYGSPYHPLDLGSGGGSDTDGPGAPGGAGGGLLILEVDNTLTVEGEIAANGVNGATSGGESGGGGSGGSIWIRTGSLAGTGVIAANGGNGGASGGGGGGGGRIAIYTCDQQMTAGQITASAGTGWQAGGIGSLFLGSGSIEITEQPIGGIMFADAILTMSVAASGDGTLEYQWRKDGVDLVDDDRIFGALTPQLTIDPLVLADGGTYEAWITDECGQYVSDPAVLIVPPPGDLNCDGLLNAFDIDPFVLALTSAPGFAAYQATYPDCRGMLADANQDGAVNSFDIDPFVILLIGGR